MTNKSNCCKAPVEVKGGIPDFGTYYRDGQTYHYECTKCHNPCDLLQEKWEDRFKGFYYNTVFQAYPDSQESHLILLKDIERFISSELESARREERKKLGKTIQKMCEREKIIKEKYYEMGQKDSVRIGDLSSWMRFGKKKGYQKIKK